MYSLEEIKDNTCHRDMLKVFKNKEILFLENDFGLHHAVGNFEFWLIENKIKYNAIYSVGSLPLEYIAKQIDYYDIIAFETTWTYEVAKTLHDYISKLKDKKTILECYISEPTWFYKPKVKHDVYVLGCNSDDMDYWKFKKLRLNKAIWEK